MTTNIITKKFVPCIYLYRGYAVKSLKDLTIVDTDPLRLARYYSEHNADELILFDLSEQAAKEDALKNAEPAWAADGVGQAGINNADALHEEALDLMKEICACVEVDVIGGGNVKRMEDIKKILYTGCKKAILDYDKASNIEITKEVFSKFGADKLVIAFEDPTAIASYKALVESSACSLLLMNPHKLRQTQESFALPFYVQINQIALNKLLEIFSYENVCGVTGNTINDNMTQILSLKDLCIENGLPVETLTPAFSWQELKKNNDGMVPVIVQDYKTQEVLMLAYMNEEAYDATLRCGKMTYFSRSRNELWLKGETSGHYQYVKSLTADCDLDTILAKVSQVGAACHTGSRSCFFNQIAKKDYEESSNPLMVFEEVYNVIKDRKLHPKEGSYTNYLFDKGIDKILKKLGEEATEIVIAAKNPNPNEVTYEISDFLYHCMVLMAEKGLTWEEITKELANR